MKKIKVPQYNWNKLKPEQDKKAPLVLTSHPTAQRLKQQNKPKRSLLTKLRDLI